MCGIAGWILSEQPSPVLALVLGQAMTERGEDSWGFYDGATISKGVGSLTQGIRAAQMVCERGFLHTRHATTGATIAENSHPFEIAGIIGAHNGMVYNHFAIGLKYNRKFAVDSMHIFQHIADGLDLEELEGYGAIQFTRASEWFVGRCNWGDLHIALLKDGKGVLWASDDSAIESAAFQAGYSIEHFYQVNQGDLYRVDVTGLYTTDKEFKLKDKPFATDKDKLKDRAATSGRFDDVFWGTGGALYDDKLRAYDERFERGHVSDEGAVVAESILIDGEREVGYCEWCSELGELTDELCEDCITDAAEETTSGCCEWCEKMAELRECNSAMLCHDCAKILA